MNASDKSQKFFLPKATRRDLLRNLTWLLGATSAAQWLSASSLAVAGAYSAQPSTDLGAGKVFSLAEMETLKQVCALVIPATDTPSAADLGVHGFIDNQLFHCHSAKEQTRALVVLKKIEGVAGATREGNFLAATASQQLGLLNALDQGQPPFDISAQEDFRLLKGLIAFGYFSSEVGATRAHRYQAIPGGFKGSIPYKAGDKAWGYIAGH